MALKNYTSTSVNTFSAIQKCLVAHKVKNMMFEYNDHGQAIGLTFGIEIEGKLLGFRLPARMDQVEQLFLETKRAKSRYEWERKNIKLDEKEKEQAYRTGWANIRDWITAQMALIDTKMAKIEEVFLPYMTNGKTTLFEMMKDQQYALPSANQHYEEAELIGETSPSQEERKM